LDQEHVWTSQPPALDHCLNASRLAGLIKKYGSCEPHFKLKVLRRMWRDELWFQLEQRRNGIHQYINYYKSDCIALKPKGLSPVEFRSQASNP
jgi:hypothetical protein